MIDIQHSLGRIQATVESIDEKVDRLANRLDHHSGRIGRLERWQATIAGAGAVAGVAVGSLLTSFRKFFD
jgi:hypothetical protein